MFRKIKWLLLLLVFVLSAFAFRKPAEKYFEIAKSLDIFATLFKEVNTYYVDEVDPQKLIRSGINGMLESLDPYTDYIPEDEVPSFRISTTGQYGGIGASIGIVNKKTVITYPYKNFPAYKAGLKVGDQLVAVDGKIIGENQTSDVSVLLKGQPKTEVEVTVRRYGEKNNIVFKIKREKISITNVSYSGMIDAGTGYIKLDDFTPGASKEVSDALTKLKSAGAKNLILDIRDNPGGLLYEAVNIVSLFINKGQEVVSTKGKTDEWNKTYNTLGNPVDVNIPMVVLTNEGSASASEIVSGALQDYDRAILIGKRTFGKGLVQTTKPLLYNAQLKITTAKYFIPSGRCIQEVDYTHRKADGSVDKILDSLRVEFKTKHGRKVFDGGGLDPDIEVEEDYLGTVTAALISSGYIFEYATLYCSEHSIQPDLKTFTLSDPEYQKFLSWISEQKFSYTTPLENDIDVLTKIAKTEKYYTELENSLSALKHTIATNKNSDLTRFKNEIVEALEQQIAFHYNLSQGLTEASLKYDNVIIEARKVLGNTTQYLKLLSAN